VSGGHIRIFHSNGPSSCGGRSGTVERTTFRRWFARYEGQTENDFHDTGRDAPAAIGMAILLMEENDAVSDRFGVTKGSWGTEVW
jgi:hypothetical protein